MNNYFIGLIFLVLSLAACSVDSPGMDSSSSEWKEVRAENFILSIPKELIAENVVGFDGYAARYSSDLMTVSIETRAGSETVSDLKRESRILFLKEETIDGDGWRGTRAAYQFKSGETNFQDKNKEFVRSLSVDCKWSVESVTFLVLFQNLSDEDTANKILNSIRVKCSE